MSNPAHTPPGFWDGSRKKKPFERWWTEKQLERQPLNDYEKNARMGWDACKEEVLKILERNWTGLDLSINSCDQYYIDEIKKL